LVRNKAARHPEQSCYVWIEFKPRRTSSNQEEQQFPGILRQIKLDVSEWTPPRSMGSISTNS